MDRILHELCVKEETLFLREKVADQAAFVFIFDPGEEFCSYRLDGFGTIKGHFGVHRTATEVARLAFCLKHWFDLGGKVYSRSCWC